MRDPARIATILEKMNALWQQYPDMRFGQLMYTLFAMLPETKRTAGSGIDSFHVEDADFEKLVDRVLENGLD
ncbi:hypothetical protein [Methanoregula sp.]|uniref:hypothetical protein n=1 Tax=Methanoregula sp. TaxID=2052170 RepID=UPI0026231DFA|nr:hypothetical protein [Methanoregula sp.]MDD5142778.1 hypothetical protein [Methanoregula sp.]